MRAGPRAVRLVAGTEAGAVGWTDGQMIQVLQVLSGSKMAGDGETRDGETGDGETSETWRDGETSRTGTLTHSEAGTARVARAV